MQNVRRNDAEDRVTMSQSLTHKPFTPLTLGEIVSRLSRSPQEFSPSSTSSSRRDSDRLLRGVPAARAQRACERRAHKVGGGPALLASGGEPAAGALKKAPASGDHSG